MLPRARGPRPQHAAHTHTHTTRYTVKVPPAILDSVPRLIYRNDTETMPHPPKTIGACPTNTTPPPHPPPPVFVPAAPFSVAPESCGAEGESFNLGRGALELRNKHPEAQSSQSSLRRGQHPTQSCISFSSFFLPCEILNLFFLSGSKLSREPHDSSR